MHNMGSIYVFVLSIFLINGKAEAKGCDSGWTAYKDEQCVKIFANFLTYEQALVHCSSQGNAASKVSLVMIKDLELQEFLANYTSDALEYLWLGGKYDEETAQFRWNEGEPLTYTNWLEGHPRNDSSSDLCIEFRPKNAKVPTTDVDGKWAAFDCQKRNLVMCQKGSTRTLQDAVGEIINLRKELQGTNQELQSTNQKLQLSNQELQSTKQDLQAVDSRVVPVGSIYIEYYHERRPTALWPNLRWEDVTSTYAGLFFRASGGGSGGWGATQTECAPRITQMETTYSTSPFPNPLSIPASGFSAHGHCGYWSQNHDGYVGVRFYTDGCEVRPKNQAIRIWKRTA